MGTEVNLRMELEQVKVSITYIIPNLWYYRVLFSLAVAGRSE